MKQPKIILAFAVVISCILFSSISLDSDKVQSKIKFDFEVRFNCTLNYRNQFASHNIIQSKEVNRTEFKATGICTLKNFDKFDLMMSHAAYKSEFGKSARIGEGTFKMKGDDGHQVFGTYEGYADLTRDPQDLILFFSIKGGTGYFHGAKGYLSARCGPDVSNPKVRILKLKGTITRTGKNTSNSLAQL
ncbi:MAG: hypothetical protein KAQ79_10575 [Cyclobacteriaceae bacterium]|nr:hypothetical protein [Cyclobacteriaceae bacterium]